MTIEKVQLSSRMNKKTIHNNITLEENSSFSHFWKTFRQHAKQNTTSFMIIALSFLAVLAVAFFDVASKETIVSFQLQEFELGQISDRTITSSKNIGPTIEHPITVEKNEKIIKKGFPITEEGYEKLQKLAASPTYIDYRAFANALIFYVLLAALAIFLFSSKICGKKMDIKEQVFLAILFVLVQLITVIASKMAFFDTSFALPILIPASLSVMLLTVLFGQQNAIFFVFLLAFSVLFITGFDPIPAFFLVASSITAIRIVRRIEKRIDMIFASFLLGLFNAIFLLCIKIIFNNPQTFSLSIILGNVFNGFVSGILALGLLTPLESLLNTASVFRLMDLSDLNNPVMKKMLIVAPGTYNHSMMVASLAESACHEIGANALLARVGAYYHDLGKIEQPEYFVENQTGNNKHEELNPRLSVSVIRRHVKKGLEKATQLRLPKEVLAIIEEHHGNSLISYFYAEAKKQDPQVSAEEFSYIGTPPQSKESAVVMLADTVEAACRTLDKPSVSRLEKFIKQLVMTKVELGQLDNSGLTFKELSSIQRAFVTILAGYYHSRIEYPNQKDPDELETGEVKKEAGTKNYDKKNTKHKTQNANSVLIKKSKKDVKEK